VPPLARTAKKKAVGPLARQPCETRQKRHKSNKRMEIIPRNKSENNARIDTPFACRRLPYPTAYSHEMRGETCCFIFFRA